MKDLRWFAVFTNVQANSANIADFERIRIIVGLQFYQLEYWYILICWELFFNSIRLILNKNFFLVFLYTQNKANKGRICSFAKKKKLGEKSTINLLSRKECESNKLSCLAIRKSGTQLIPWKKTSNFNLDRYATIMQPEMTDIEAASYMKREPQESIFNMVQQHGSL